MEPIKIQFSDARIVMRYENLRVILDAVNPTLSIDCIVNTDNNQQSTNVFKLFLEVYVIDPSQKSFLIGYADLQNPINVSYKEQKIPSILHIDNYTLNQIEKRRSGKDLVLKLIVNLTTFSNNHGIQYKK